MRLTTFLLPALLAASSYVFADADHQAVRDRIELLVPGSTDVSIAETPLDGILEVRVGSEVVYMTADGRFLFQGRVVDLETQTDLTEAAQAKLRHAAIEQIDKAQSISFGPENPAHEIYVFTDIDCGYCRRMHGQIDEYNEQGIAFHYLMYPRAGQGSHSWNKAASVWCANDQQEAMTVAKLGQEPDPVECDDPLDDQFRLGRDVGVTGTPALVTMDGVLIPGYVQPEQLRARLDQLNGQ